MSHSRTHSLLIFSSVLVALGALGACGGDETGDQPMQEIDYGPSIFPDAWGVVTPGVAPCKRNELSEHERALLKNIGSKGFTWATGTIEQARYEPIGELANYFGFAALRTEVRDNADDPLADEGLRGSSWRVVLENLDASQRAVLYQAGRDQAAPFAAFLETRESFVEALWGLKEGEAPSFETLSNLMVEMGEHEAQITLVSAAAFGEVIQSLSPEQVTLFDEIRAGATFVSELRGLGLYAEEVAGEMRELSEYEADIMSETASKFLAYATGTVEAAVFLPPGKISNYFGFAWYRYEDRADVNRNEAAEMFYDVLNEEQEEVMCHLAKEVVAFEEGYIEGRAALIGGAYPLRDGESVDEAALTAQYVDGAIAEGRLGAISAYYFDHIERSFSAEQREELRELRRDSL